MIKKAYIGLLNRNRHESIILSITFKGKEIEAVSNLLRLIDKGNPRDQLNCLTIDLKLNEIMASDSRQLAKMPISDFTLFDESLGFVLLDGANIRRSAKNVTRIEVIEENGDRFGIITMKNGKTIKTPIVKITKRLVDFNRTLHLETTTPKKLPVIGEVKITKKLKSPLVLKFSKAKDLTKWTSFSFEKLVGVKVKKNQIVEVRFQDGLIKVYAKLAFTEMEYTILKANDIMQSSFFTKHRLEVNPELDPKLFIREKYDKKLLAYIDDMVKDEFQLLGEIGTCHKDINESVYLNFEYLENALDAGEGIKLLTRNKENFPHSPIIFYSKTKTSVVMPIIQ